jgi:peptide/nickel transport system permease protein
VSESHEVTPAPEEIISTPAVDMLMPSTQPNNTAPSERKQARKENWRLIRRRPSFIIGNIIAIFWVVCAIFGEAITPHDPLDFRSKPHQSPNGDFWFGTDKTGRDVLSRVMAGARDVLKIAPAAALLGVFFGVILGLLMGYVGKRLDMVLSRVVEAFLALPVVLIALLAITTLGNSSWVVLGVVAVLFTPVVARTVRSAVLAERDLDYVTSARLRGESTPFIMFREVLPNVSGPIIVELTVRVGYAVFTISTLSFLGAGPPPPSPDWGAQVSEGFNSISAGIWWTTFFPAAAIASLVIAVNLIADSVQSVLEAS